MPYPTTGCTRAPAGENPVRSQRAKLYTSSSGTPQLGWHSLTRSSAWGQLPKCTRSSIPGLPLEPAPFPHLPASRSARLCPRRLLHNRHSLEQESKIAVFIQSRSWAVLPALTQDFTVAAAAAQGAPLATPPSTHPRPPTQQPPLTGHTHIFWDLPDSFLPFHWMEMKTTALI